MTDYPDTTFYDAELDYLASQRLGRLATVTADGEPQNSPVAFRYNPDTATIDIGGYSMGTTRKFRNVRATGRASLVVDDIVSTTPWKVRGLEIRGNAEALEGQTPPNQYMSPEIIRIHPRRIIRWGLGSDSLGMHGRDVQPAGATGGTR